MRPGQPHQRGDSLAEGPLSRGGGQGGDKKGELKIFLKNLQKYIFPAKQVLIIDARSYAAAVGNRARGGGVECPEYYPNSEILFMNLANIHSIRYAKNPPKVELK